MKESNWRIFSHLRGGDLEGLAELEGEPKEEEETENGVSLAQSPSEHGGR